MKVKYLIGNVGLEVVDGLLEVSVTWTSPLDAKTYSEGVMLNRKQVNELLDTLPDLCMELSD